MPADPESFRPKRFPPPEFPPRREALFARMPPVAFTAVLGLVALDPAFHLVLALIGLPDGIGQLLSGALVMLWAFTALALAVKLFRRPATLTEDLRVIPSRNGLFAAGLGGIFTGWIVGDYAPGLGQGLIWLSLGWVVLVAGLCLARARREAGRVRAEDPGWHLVAAAFLQVAVICGMEGDSRLSLITCAVGVLLSLLIYALNLPWLNRSKGSFALVPSVLRPMLALNILPLALLATYSSVSGWELTGKILTGLAVLIFLIVVYMLTSDKKNVDKSEGKKAKFTPVWAEVSLPLIALAQALSFNGFGLSGLVLILISVLVVPVISWRVLKLWPKGRLAAMSNAAQA